MTDNSQVLVLAPNILPFNYAASMANEIDSAKERFSLITRRLTEINGGDTILEMLASGGAPKCFWGEHLMPTLINRMIKNVLIRGLEQQLPLQENVSKMLKHL